MTDENYPPMVYLSDRLIKEHGKELTKIIKGNVAKPGKKAKK